MTRLIEIILFCTPFAGFAAWRFLAPSERPPTWLLAGAAGFVVLLFASLFWLRSMDASDAVRVYVPAQLQGDRVVPGHAAPP